MKNQRVANTVVVLVIVTLEFRICFDQFYKIRRVSNYEFSGQDEPLKTKICLVPACPGKGMQK